MKNLFVGCTYEIVANWQEWVDPPAVGNRKPETYVAALPELWAKVEAKLQNEPHWLVSVPSAIRLLLEGRALKDGAEDVFSVRSFIHKVADLAPVRIWAVHPLRIMRLACMELIDQNEKLPFAVAASSFSIGGNGTDEISLADPYVLSGASASSVSYERWLGRFGIAASVFSNGSVTDPAFIYHIVKKMGLL